MRWRSERATVFLCLLGPCGSYAHRLCYNVTTRCNMQCRHCGDDVWGDPAHDLPFPVIEQL